MSDDSTACQSHTCIPDLSSHDFFIDTHNLGVHFDAHCGLRIRVEVVLGVSAHDVGFAGPAIPNKHNY